MTRSLDDYFALASRCADDPDFLADLKARTSASRTSALFDTKRFARNLERGLELIWNRHVQGLPPGNVDVTPQTGVSRK